MTLGTPQASEGPMTSPGITGRTCSPLRRRLLTTTPAKIIDPRDSQGPIFIAQNDKTRRRAKD